MNNRSFTYLFCLLFFLFCLTGIGTYNYFISRLGADLLKDFWLLNTVMVLAVAGLSFLLFLLIRRHEQKAESHNWQYRQLFEDNPNPMWVFDKETFAFLAVNQAAVAQYGYSKEEFLRMNILDIRPGEDAMKVKKNLKEAPADYYSTGIWRHYRKDKSLLYVKISSHGMHFNNRPSEIILASDLTEQVKYEKEREQLMNNLLQQNHQLEEFAYIASHQLRAPVANILGLTTIFDLVKEDEVPGIIQRMKESATRLDETIKKVVFLLEKKKDVYENLEEVELEAILKKALESMEQQIKSSDAQIEHDFSALPRLFTIRNYLQDILNSLLSNALKYRKPGVSSHISIYSYQKGSQAFLSIKDNGLGLDLEKHASGLGKPFTRFHFHVPGSGIGLSLVKTQLDILKGKIYFHSSPEEGMQVEISLPL
jgi:PAS domain S-box-containing protein